MTHSPLSGGPSIGGLPQLDSLRPKKLAAGNAPLELAPATSHETRWAFAVVLLSILALTASVPFTRVPLPKITAFIPSYEAALAICDLVTAVLLFGRVDRQRSRAFMALACGYLFNAAIVLLHALSFPGAFSETGLLGSNDQTTAWLYIFWHGGFPLFVLGYAVLPESDNAPKEGNKKVGWPITLGIIGVFGVVTALMLLATIGHDLLPRIIEAGNYSRMISTGASPAALTLSVLALFAIWWRHERTVLDLWLMVVMSVSAIEITFSAIISSSRYDLGWYVGRSYGFVAACCLLIVLLFETNRLHARLNDALAVARGLERHLTFRAENDFLTGLPNRSLFYDRLEMAMVRSRRSKHLMALLYLDIDNFKGINDGLGHAAGDEVLRTFARRLLECVRASDTVARLGGDEFTVILENLSSQKVAQDVVKKITEAFCQTCTAGDREIEVKASIGIAYFAGEQLEADGLIKQADMALYQAKQEGRDRYSIYVSDTASIAQA